MNFFSKSCFLCLSAACFITACRESGSAPTKYQVDQLHLKSGQLISCGSPDKEFGVLDFGTSCDQKLKNDFNVAVELLHSFEYDESEKMFAKIIGVSPGCAMAYWGVAMCNVHPLWEAPTEADLQKGSKAIAIAYSITQKSEKESGYIDAIAAYYKDWNKTNPHARAVHFENAMEALHKKYPGDKEAAIFYALALDAAADPADKTFSRQKKAGEILNALYAAEPNHPGIIHYLIHTYDYPGLAILALPAAKRYADVAPSSAHALHMPSHIFTRLGLWDDCIRSNLKSIEAAKCYTGSAGISGHWDEELHGLDYLVYAYLQKGDNKLAREQLGYLQTISETHPVNFKVAYAFAAIPARYALENRDWKAAADLQIHPAGFPWQKFPWQEAIIHFARAMGAIHSGNRDEAGMELKKLNGLHDSLVNQKDTYKSRQVEIQINITKAWMQFKAGNKAGALTLMKLAAAMEDSTQKHPVTPGEVIPANEWLGDMLLQMQQPANALLAYEAELNKAPNRFNGLYRAGLAAEKSGNHDKAILYYRQLIKIADTVNATRPELAAAKSFLRK